MRSRYKKKLTFYLTFDNSTTGDYKYCIMDRRFDNGNMPAYKKETIGNVSYATQIVSVDCTKSIMLETNEQ